MIFMNEEQALKFLECLGAKNIQELKGNWIKCSCPLAPYKHSKHKDYKPSFGLYVDEHEYAHYNCFACGSGTAFELIQSLELYTRSSQEGVYVTYNFKLAHDIVSGEEIVPYELGPYQEFGASSQKIFEPWPESYLESFDLALNVPLARDYLLSSKDHVNEFGQKCRGISEEQCTQFDLRYDWARGMVMFPYRNVYGAFAGIRGRSITEKKFHDYTFNGINNAQLCWWNETCLNLPGASVVVEGQFDGIRVAKYWPKVVATMTAFPSSQKLKKLTHSEAVVVIPDNDETGLSSVGKYREFFKTTGTSFYPLFLPNELHDADEACSEYLYDEICKVLSM